MLERIALTNFKAFRQLELPLARLTLLAGWNSSGKSTLLQAVAVLRQSHEAGLLANAGLLLNGQYIELGTGRDVLHEDYLNHSLTRGEPEIAIRLDVDGRQVERVFRYAPESDLLGYAAPVADLCDDASPEAFLVNGFQFLRAERVGPAVHYPRSYRAVEVDHTLGVKGEHTAN